MRIITILGLVLLWALSSRAQTVSNELFYTEGSSIIVKYDLNKTADITLYYHTDNSYNWKRVYSANGDMGANIPAGNGKTIRWEILNDLPEGLQDRYIGFKLVAVTQTGYAYEPEMVKVLGGTFTMGSDDGDADEKPPHSVTLSDFYIGKYEVTVEQFRRFIDDTGYQTDAEKPVDDYGSFVFENGSWDKKDGINWRHDAEGKLQTNDQHPVIHVSWNDAMEYCKWLSRKTGKTYTLPTEAQWEYAAGNGSRHTKYAWGNGNPTNSKGGNVADETKRPSDGVGWSSKFEGYTDGYWFTAPVGKFGANDFGLYDMTGNVWEWCADWYGTYPSGSASNPSGASSGSLRVLRGGSWSIDPQNCRVAHRINGTPSDRHNVIGFRLALPSR